MRNKFMNGSTAKKLRHSFEIRNNFDRKERRQSDYKKQWRNFKKLYTRGRLL